MKHGKVDVPLNVFDCQLPQDKHRIMPAFMHVRHYSCALLLLLLLVLLASVIMLLTGHWWQLDGRIRDTPIIGAGTWADKYCSLCGTDVCRLFIGQAAPHNASAAVALPLCCLASFLPQFDGRIGDTPIIGAGTWADKRCALSGTGVGEEFIRRAAAHDVAARVAYKGYSLREAMREVVWESFAEGDGGFVGVDADYNIVWDFNRCVWWWWWCVCVWGG